MTISRIGSEGWRRISRHWCRYSLEDASYTYQWQVFEECTEYALTSPPSQQKIHNHTHLFRVTEAINPSIQLFTVLTAPFSAERSQKRRFTRPIVIRGRVVTRNSHCGQRAASRIQLGKSGRFVFDIAIDRYLQMYESMRYDN